MKTAIPLLATTAGLAAAQDFKDVIPECAHDCFDAGIAEASTCDVTDGVCICSEEFYVPIYEAIQLCVLADCGQEVAFSDVLPASQQFCIDALGLDASSSESAGPSTVATEESSSSATEASATDSPASESTTAEPTSGEIEAAATTSAEETSTAPADGSSEDQGSMGVVSKPVGVLAVAVAALAAF